MFYGNLDYKKIIVGMPNCSDQFKKIIHRYKEVAYHMDNIRQSARMVVNSITVFVYHSVLSNCTTVGQVPDSMLVLT